MNTKPNNRDARIDSLKGFLILLVILGHLIGESDIISQESMWGGVRVWIYLFHMPLFALLSGYFSKRKSNNSEIFNSLKGIALTLIIFQLISLLLLYIIRHEFSIGYMVRPYWTLWYLLSLIFWRILLQYTPKRLLDNPFLYLIVMSIISIVSGLCLPYGQILSIQRTLSFYPFFLFGFFMGQSQFEVSNNYFTKVSALAIILIMTCLVLGGIMPEDTNRLLLGAYRYPIGQLPTKMLLFVGTLFMSLSFYVLFKECPVLAKIGKDSLFYYLYHGILIQFVTIPVFAVFNIQWNSISLLSVFIVITIVLWLMSNNKMLHKMAYPLR